MRSNARLKKRQDSQPRRSGKTSPPKSLRLVNPSNAASITKPRAQKTYQPREDPLDKPVLGFCGLCGNRINNTAVEESRLSGANHRQQTWEYHELCWKKLERMRRIDDKCWQEKKPIGLDVRYSAYSSGEGFESPLFSKWSPNLAG